MPLSPAGPGRSAAAARPGPPRVRRRPAGGIRERVAESYGEVFERSGLVQT